MKQLELIRRFDRYLMKIEEFILSYAVILIFVMVTGNVLSRAITKSSWSFSAEVSQFAVIIATFMGISYAARKGRHIRMSAFFDLAPKRMKKILAIMISAVTAIILLVLAYFSTDYVLWTMSTGRVTTALQVPAYFMAIFLPIGFVLGALQYFRNVWINLKEEEVYIGTEKLDFSEKENEPEVKAQII